MVPHWPRPWGRGAGPVEQLIVDEELSRAGVAMPDNPIGIGWAGPTIIAAGSPEQQARWIPPMLRGTEFWCQLFSEPGAGSDLAALSTRAVRDGDHYVVNGQKVWNTWADRSKWGILLVRTDPTAPKHKGITYLVCPMDAPGITVRPIVEMSGGTHFTEVFFDDVLIPVDHRIGAEGHGWNLAKVTLDNERVSLSHGGVLWGMGPTTADFVAMVHEHGGIADPHLRQRFAEVVTEQLLLRLAGEQIAAASERGQGTGAAASMRKLMADLHGQKVMALAKDLSGAGGLLDDVGPYGGPAGEWHWGYLFSRALTIGGGTTQVQRNILAEQVLGLPRDADPDRGRSWNERT